MKTSSILILLCGYVGHAAAGSLTGLFSHIAEGSNVNLTASGKLDWVHWGLYTDASEERKGSVAPQISTFSLVGNSNDFLAAYRYTDNSNSYSWYDGTPTTTVTNTTTGVWAYQAGVQGSDPLGSGFQLTVPADTNSRTLQVFVGAFAAKGQFEASLSDGSAPAFTSAPNATVNNLSNGPGGAFTIDYAADSPGQTLTVRWKVALTYQISGNVTLQAATLTAPGVDSPPYVILTNPVEDASFPEPATVLIQAQADDFDGTVTNVAFFADTNRLGEAPAPPYEFTWLNASRGKYSLRAAATDNSGVTSWSPAVDVFVYGAGGSLTGVLESPPAALDLTSEGAADWTHWGLVTATNFDHKSVPIRQVSDFTALGTNAVQQYADNYTAFSWSDGSPTPSVAGTPTGVFITGIDNGFMLAAPADTSPRTLRVYVGGYGVQGQFQAYLSDLSAPPYADGSISNYYDNSYGVYALDYTAGSAGQQLVVIYRSQELFDVAYGNVTLQAATLQGGASEPLPVSILNPAMDGAGYTFSFLSQANHNYIIQYTAVLPATNWETITTLRGTGGILGFTNQNATGLQGYYRVETQ